MTIVASFSSGTRAVGSIPAALLAAVLGSSVGLALAAPDAPPAKPLPVALVDTFNQLSGGPHAGYRANHAKGVVVEGQFTPSAEAATLSKAPHFAASVPVVVRFSNGTGVPTMPDADPNGSPHGIAIRFLLPGGASTDIVSISADRFPVATPEEFLALLHAITQSGPTAAKPTPIEQFLGSHPAALKWVTTPRPAPDSFATLAFYGINAFKFTNANGATQYARYQILPVAGEHALNEADTAKSGPNYLMDELQARVVKAPVQYRLLAQVAGAGDPVNDATVAWPADRKLVELGTLTLNQAIKDQAAPNKTLLFNPVALPAGIEPSDDPILHARFPAYAVSFGQRAP